LLARALDAIQRSQARRWRVRACSHRDSARGRATEKVRATDTEKPAPDLLESGCSSGRRHLDRSVAPRAPSSRLRGRPWGRHSQAHLSSQAVPSRACGALDRSNFTGLGRSPTQRLATAFCPTLDLLRLRVLVERLFDLSVGVSLRSARPHCLPAWHYRSMSCSCRFRIILHSASYKVGCEFARPA
jgi:hypothetical protein